MSAMFKFAGDELPYFKHPYNHAGENMRAVEVPIVWQFLKLYDWATILEAGNVLSHYHPINWPVIDAKEKGPWVTNADIMTWRPARPVDVLVSISTLEHIGHGRYADYTSAPVTPAAALAHMLTWLAPGGNALLTVPLGYNELLDKQLAAGEMPVDEARYMRRVSAANDWAECTLREALAAQRPARYRWPVAMAALFCHKAGEMKILNIGCGNRIIKGAVHLDRTKHRKEIDIAHDLNVLPWPFEDKSFDKIVAIAVLEHLDIDLLASFNECHRILRPGGQLVVKLPLQGGPNAYDDPTHRWFFTVRSLDQFCPETRRGKAYSFYTTRKWKFIKAPRANSAKTSLHAILEALP